MAGSRHATATAALALLLSLLLLLPAALASSREEEEEDCRWTTREIAATALPSHLRLPPAPISSSSSSSSVHILQLLSGGQPTHTTAAGSSKALEGALPPGLHLFLDAPDTDNDTDNSNSTLAAHLERQLLPALLPPTSLSTLRPLVRQFATVPPAVACGVRRLLGVEGGGGRQLLWFHANEPAALSRALPLAATAPVIHAAAATADADADDQQESSTLLGYHLTLSSSSASSAARLTTYTCAATAAAAAPPACEHGCAQLQLVAAEPPGTRHTYFTSGKVGFKSRDSTLSYTSPTPHDPQACTGKWPSP